MANNKFQNRMPLPGNDNRQGYAKIQNTPENKTNLNGNCTDKLYVLIDMHGLGVEIHVLHCQYFV